MTEPLLSVFRSFNFLIIISYKVTLSFYILSLIFYLPFILGQGFWDTLQDRTKTGMVNLKFFFTFEFFGRLKEIISLQVFLTFPPTRLAKYEAIMMTNTLY